MELWAIGPGQPSCWQGQGQWHGKFHGQVEKNASWLTFANMGRCHSSSVFGQSRRPLITGKVMLHHKNHMWSVDWAIDSASQIITISGRVKGCRECPRQGRLSFQLRSLVMESTSDNGNGRRHQVESEYFDLHPSPLFWTSFPSEIDTTRVASFVRGNDVDRVHCACTISRMRNEIPRNSRAVQGPASPQRTFTLWNALQE